MKVALLSIPARGEINVLLATCYALIRVGHDVTICTGSSFRGAIDSCRNEQDDPLLQSRIHYCDLGRQKAVEDLTREIQAALKDMRKQPGDYTSMEAHQTVALVPRSQFRDAATNVCDRLLEMDPDMSKSRTVRSTRPAFRTSFLTLLFPTLCDWSEQLSSMLSRPPSLLEHA